MAKVSGTIDPSTMLTQLPAAQSAVKHLTEVQSWCERPVPLTEVPDAPAAR